MPSAFNFTISPFDCLNGEERTLVRNSLDIAYFREGAEIMTPGAHPEHLYVLIKGVVQQWDGEELVASYGPDDSFDGRALVSGKASSRFVAAEEVVAYQLAKEAVTELIASNATFGALLFSDLSKKLSALSERQGEHELQSLTLARVEEVFIRPAVWVDANDDIVSVVRVFRDKRTTNVMVRDNQTDPPNLGVFTITGLERAVLHGTPLNELKVRELANFNLITVKPKDALFEALALMIRHKIHRLVVRDGDHIIGFLQQLDLLSFLSNHSYLIMLQVLEAQDLSALEAAAGQITRSVTMLHRAGTKVEQIARLVQELNAKLFERAWQLIAPADLVANSCLFVMGSEGRGEQILKTDQDNGLILRDGYDCPHDLAAICQRFSDALATFGYPECQGHIMVSNPDWRHPASGFAQRAKGWLLQPSPDNVMALAIFLDAHAVCGDASLLAHVRQELFKLATDNMMLLSRFAASVEAFNEGSGWWSRVLSLGDSSGDKLDLKKAGTFPLVHGVRALALEQHLDETSTTARIEALVEAEKLPAQMGTDLIECLRFFMGLKLKTGLQAIAQGKQPGGIEVDKLSSLDRDLLKDALGVVKRFKTMLRMHYRLDIL
ncbi:MAG TPA: DUF294 nucleotidyltransferase-like domain-containing protein [Burkholderiaceae bacterium]|nr:DUF294 nucleotidyltransferase-like domain-containing protein [Burkholderiaceae bacterium]HMX11913.1 DUF294 nucleotidyltransferase-like domain-containing protein [Burkholderiaceae bacterium]HNB45071.1 DUF294 nucleotidyltransferase-like domain-containing protein [Burkholderiaceae bacterium]